MNARFVYRPPFDVPDKERKFGNLTLTYAMQIHACVVEVDPETGVYELVDYAAVDDCGVRVNPKIVEGQVMGATAHAIGAAMFEVVRVRRRGQPADARTSTTTTSRTRSTCRRSRPARSSRRRRSRRSARRGWARAAAAGSTASAPRSRTRCARPGGAIVTISHNPYHRVWEMLRHPERSREKVEVMSK